MLRGRVRRIVAAALVALVTAATASVTTARPAHAQLAAGVCTVSGWVTFNPILNTGLNGNIDIIFDVAGGCEGFPLGNSIDFYAAGPMTVASCELTEGTGTMSTSILFGGPVPTEQILTASYYGGPYGIVVEVFPINTRFTATVDLAWSQLSAIRACPSGVTSTNVTGTITFADAE